jgi:hypothetical protein
MPAALALFPPARIQSIADGIGLHLADNFIKRFIPKIKAGVWFSGEVPPWAGYSS